MGCGGSVPDADKTPVGTKKTWYDTCHIRHIYSKNSKHCFASYFLKKDIFGGI